MSERDYEEPIYVGVHHIVKRRTTWADLEELRQYEQHCQCCESVDVAWAHLLDSEAALFRIEGDEYTLPAFVFLCEGCETYLREGALDQMASLLDQRGEDDGLPIAKALQRADQGGRAFSNRRS